MSVIDQMKQRILNSGRSAGKLFRIKSGEKKRFRFLNEADQGVQIVIHDKFPEVTTPCAQQFGKPCPYDKMSYDEIRTRDNYAWSIWDYEAKEVKIWMWKANDRTPIPSLISYYENYGTILDRDYVLERRGEKFDTSYTLVPQDKSRFTGAKVKPMTAKEIMNTVAQAMNPELLESDEAEPEEDEVEDLFDEDDE